MKLPTIINAVIVNLGLQYVLMVELSSGELEDLFTYYPDELSFTASEFIGLTREQAIDYYHSKDIAYLRS